MKVAPVFEGDRKNSIVIKGGAFDRSTTTSKRGAEYLSSDFGHETETFWKFTHGGGVHELKFDLACPEPRPIVIKISHHLLGEILLTDSTKGLFEGSGWILYGPATTTNGGWTDFEWKHIGFIDLGPAREIEFGILTQGFCPNIKHLCFTPAEGRESTLTLSKHIGCCTIL
jgi:hypothetical protein